MRNSNYKPKKKFLPRFVGISDRGIGPVAIVFHPLPSLAEVEAIGGIGKTSYRVIHFHAFNKATLLGRLGFNQYPTPAHRRIDIKALKKLNRALEQARKGKRFPRFLPEEIEHERSQTRTR